MPDYSEYVTLEDFFSVVSLTSTNYKENDRLALDSTVQNINILLDEMESKGILYKNMSTKDIIIQDPFCPSDEKFIKFLFSDRIIFDSNLDVKTLNTESLRRSIESNLKLKVESDLSRYKYLLTTKRYLKDPNKSNHYRKLCLEMEKIIENKEYIHVFNSLRNVGCLRIE